jgi:hypothetical protein
MNITIFKNKEFHPKESPISGKKGRSTVLLLSQQYFNYIVTFRFIGRGNLSTPEKTADKLYIVSGA